MSNERALPTITEFVGRHITWVLSLLPFVLVGINLFSNSGGDIVTFRYLLQDVNIVVLLLASLVPLIPLTIFWALVVGIEWIIRTPQDQRVINIPDWIFVPIVGGLGVIVLYMPTLALIANIVLVVFFLAVRRFFRWLRRNDDVDPLRGESMRSDFLGFIMYLVAAALLTSPGMWLPTEAVKVRNWNYTGYVLSVSDQWTTMMDRDDKIQIFSSADIRSRRPCVQYDSWMGRPVWNLLSDKPRHMPCPN